MRPDKIKELTLRADILAVAELMETTASEGKEFTEDSVHFVVAALRQIAASVGMLEEVSEGLRRRLSAADARIEALTIPDYLKSTRDNIAIREGRAAGKVIDLRDFFEREQRLDQRLDDVSGESNKFTGETA